MAYIKSVTSLKVSLSSAQILALNSSPVSLIPAPGPGKVIVVTNLTTSYNYGTVAYAGGGNLNLVQGANNVIQLGNLLAGGASTIKLNFPSSATLTANASLDAFMTGANPTLGDGTVDFHIQYYILTL